MIDADRINSLQTLHNHPINSPDGPINSTYDASAPVADLWE